MGNDQGTGPRLKLSLTRWEQLEQIANGRDLNDVLAEAVDQYLAQHGTDASASEEPTAPTASNGEKPSPGADDGGGDLPPSRMKGDKPNPLRRWAQK